MPHFAYPPASLLTGLPAAAAGLDPRYVNAAADILAGLLIFLAGSRAGRPDIGCLCAGTYMCLPGAPFMIEMAWLDPQLAAFTGIFLIWCTTRTWLAGISLGGALITKQYGLVTALPGIRAYWLERRTLFIGFAVALAVLAPFVVWSPQQFWWYVFANRDTAHARTWLFGISVPTWLYREAGVPVPVWLLWGIRLLLFALLVRATPVGGRVGVGLWSAAMQCVFILFNGFAFFNHYYLVLFLLLLGIAEGSGQGKGMYIAGVRRARAERSSGDPPAQDGRAG